jgi:hypothetical protein
MTVLTTRNLLLDPNLKAKYDANKTIRIFKAGDMVTVKVHIELRTILGPRDVLIKVHATSLNYRDTPFQGVNLV